MELCSQLNYLRSLSPGKAYFYYLDEDNKMRPLQIDRTHLRAPKSGYSEAFSGNFKSKNIAPQDLSYSNPHFIEECYVPPGVDDIYCAFSLRVRANSLSPEVCVDNEVRDILCNFAALYKELGGYRELARRYAQNILMATWVWRNRECRSIRVEVKTEDKEWVITDARFLDWYGSWDKDSQLALDEFTDYLSQALSDRTSYFNMDIKAKLTVGWGDEVYPSQEFLDVKEAGKPTKQLAKVLVNGAESAAFHSQKIGAAIQLIDDWWDENADKPLRVNEYGADKEYVIARRHSSLKRDFYSLAAKTESYVESMRETNLIPDDVHFIMAVLTKGGVFSGASKKGKKDE
ncbi:type I-F CRISPR-associated protein Csy3 [Vibrio fluvialis]|uniref:type I-F CRISPR-associated protein Csy3 n=1 Tax=Vibrio fluvialis TaxID=676 RepID=UPI001C9C375B|nr:type I-F CRISPR-associated protein Csy3 [Vibrio fluvialis]MBY7888186.1 type I-F CRISPR-associated protein Csy3 [Vibrio fluvialis]MCE7611400.1 type I-F CRISPR-associated protein Csy3 [Vibrio fluvialis]MCE7621607.1 type I-F CRISPR-associated protein Csy3 [Vibrio fluvialis]MCE7626691.1 type I-F CRISPR-associated protein Csy3 [Vibrio fluvialis]